MKIHGCLAKTTHQLAICPQRIRSGLYYLFYKLPCIIGRESSETIIKFEQYAKSQGLDKEKVSDISIDMSPAFISDVEKVFPNAEITVDKFHVRQLIQKAFDSIRKLFGRKEGGTN